VPQFGNPALQDSEVCQMDADRLVMGVFVAVALE